MYFFSLNYICFGLVVLLNTGQLNAKSSYLDGDYSEAGGDQRMCMRCHMQKLVQSGKGSGTLNISSTLSSILAGAQVNVTLSRSNFPTTWRFPGLAVHFEHESPFASRIPQTFGWEILADPKNNAQPGNFIVLDKASKVKSSFTWIFKAPQKPGSYRLATSAWFNDGDSVVAINGTLRAGNSITIMVNKAQETIKPTLLAVTSLYQKYVYLILSEAIDEAIASNVNNYTITNLTTQQTLAINSASVSRDNKTVILKTDLHVAGTNYSVRVVNLKDYAQTANTIDPVTKNYTPDLTTAYNIYAEWTQDVTDVRIEEYDEIEFLGVGLTNKINRINLVFPVPDNPVDMLPDINFVKATLRVRVVKSQLTTSSAQNWEVYRLNPSSLGWEFFSTNVRSGGYNGPVIANQFLWSGANMSSQPITTIAKQVTQVINGSPETWWEWDITSDFRPRYQNPGGTGTNQQSYFLRLKAKNESPSNGGVGFYGHDASQLVDAPHIALEFGTPVGIRHAEALAMANKFTTLQLAPNPFSYKAPLIITIPDRASLEHPLLTVSSTKGEIVRTLLPEPYQTGKVRFLWDGKGRDGSYVTSGIYVITGEYAGNVFSQNVVFHR